jgi:hypothetical protein
MNHDEEFPSPQQDIKKNPLVTLSFIGGFYDADSKEYTAEIHNEAPHIRSLTPAITMTPSSRDSMDIYSVTSSPHPPQQFARSKSPSQGQRIRGRSLTDGPREKSTPQTWINRQKDQRFVSGEANTVTTHLSGNQGQQFLSDNELDKWLHKRHIARIHAYISRDNKRQLRIEDEEVVRPKNGKMAVGTIIGVVLIIMFIILFIVAVVDAIKQHN